MVKRFCIVDGCYNFTGTSSSITFHAIPKKNVELMDKWKKVLSINRNNGFICSEHFHEDSLVHNSKFRHLTLKKDAVPIISIPERWLRKAQQKRPSEFESRPREKKEIIRYWRGIATDRAVIDEKLRIRNSSRPVQVDSSEEESDEDESCPWWFTRDLSKDSKTPFWDDSNPEAWTKLWPDEELEMSGQKKKLFGRSIMKKILPVQDSDLSSSDDSEDEWKKADVELETIYQWDILPLPSPVFYNHPGATDNIVEDRMTVVALDNELPDKDKTSPVGEGTIRIRSVDVDAPQNLTRIIVQPVLDFRDKKKILHMPAKLVFPRLSSIKRKATVLDVAKKIAEVNVQKCMEVSSGPKNKPKIQSSIDRTGHKKSMVAIDKELTRKNPRTFSVVRTTNSMDIKVHKLALSHAKKAATKKFISSEGLKFRRAERRLNIAIRKAKKDLKRLRTK